MLGIDFDETIQVENGRAYRQETDETNGVPDACEPLPATTRRSRGKKGNKPTLSCTACVSRKTKCDRARPACLACYRRQTLCEYSALADIITVTNTLNPKRRNQRPKRTESAREIPPATAASPVWTSPQQSSGKETFNSSQLPPSPSFTDEAPSDDTARLFPHRSEHLTQNRPSLFNLFSMSARHPFHNLWTDSGGLSEVLTVLPTKEEADLLMQRYFDITDPLYPIVHKETFIEEYNHFWHASPEEKQLCDPAHLALQFAMFATGAQYMDIRPPDARETTSEFYLSCCHQSLCLSSYLNQCSLVTLQTMILICQFLIANHRVSDAWTFSGITQRQAYGLQLHRDPALTYPNAPFWENQIRCRLWQATMFQDTSLSLYLELPPATTHHEIQPGCLKLSEEPAETVLALETLEDSSCLSANDISYLRAMWQFTQFAQECMCLNKSLKRSISTDTTNKSQLISRLRNLYLNFDPPFNTYDPSRFENKPQRLTRQLVQLSSNFFYALTVLYMDNNEAAGIECDVYGALDASHEAMAAFFALARLSSGQADMWGAAQIRAYSQASMIATALATQRKPSNDGPRDPRLMLAKSNLDRYIDILVRARGSFGFDTIRQKRLADLQSLRDKIVVV